MKKEFFWSLVVHVLIISATLVSSPFEPKSRIDYGEVIHVSLPSADQIPSPKTIPPAPVEIPQAMMDEAPEIAIESPTTKPAAEISKPKEKPESKPKKPLQLDADKADKDQTGARDGKVDTESMGAGGAAFAGATVDNANFTYNYWISQAFIKIMNNFRMNIPYDGRLVCVVHFEVIKSGRVINLEVVQPSGLETFDKAYLAAIERSAPFPPLPQDFREEIVGFTVPFEWKPR
jgi:protein TonB